MAKKKILVVDDKEDVVEMMKEIIEMLFEAEVSTAVSGKLALERMEEINFDLVILDVLMPEMDGLELLVQVKKINPNIPVVMMSGYTNQIKYEDLMRAGASEFIMKPFEIQEIRLAIKNFL